MKCAVMLDAGVEVVDAEWYDVDCGCGICCALRCGRCEMVVGCRPCGVM